ncbi:MAG: hypothetical protein ACKO23_07190 [Gemmataceae bacterium]
MSEPEYVQPDQLEPGPIRNESLPPVLLAQIKQVFDVIGPYIGMTLEEFEIGFMRDMNPANEVAIWASITAVWRAYHEKYLDGEKLPAGQGKNLLGALVAISTGVKDGAKLAVPEEIGHRLLHCYKNLSGK